MIAIAQCGPLGDFSPEPVLSTPQGMLTLRDGDFAQESDALLPFEGVFVLRTGELRLILETRMVGNVTGAWRVSVPLPTAKHRRRSTHLRLHAHPQLADISGKVKSCSFFALITIPRVHLARYSSNHNPAVLTQYYPPTPLARPTRRGGEAAARANIQGRPNRYCGGAKGNKQPFGPAGAFLSVLAVLVLGVVMRAAAAARRRDSASCA